MVCSYVKLGLILSCIYNDWLKSQAAWILMFVKRGVSSKITKGNSSQCNGHEAGQIFT